MTNPIQIPSLDPLQKNGPQRILSGVARTFTPVLDVDYGEYMTWLYLGTSGNVSYVKWDGTTQVLLNLVAGVFHPIFSLRINTSGTTATNIVVGS